jgi:acyl-homoserine-lactone acylase
MGLRRASGAIAIALAALAALPVTGEAYDAQISRTKYGVPHIKAKSIADLGFGVGYAFAEDNICTMADTYVTVRAQRSRYFGPGDSWVFSGNGARYDNLESDFYFQKIKEQRLVERLMRKPAPEGPLPFVRKGVRGYVAGYNAYLRETGVNKLPDPRCRGEEWVRPIKQIDAYRRFFQLGILASSGAAIDGISGAEPVLPVGQAGAERRQDRALEDLEEGRAEGFFPLESGSNAYGLGSQATSNGKGMVLGNPHFPWDGAERLYQMHLKIPGRVDVSGAGLYGVPLVLIGHTRGLAWSHTVASAWRFTPYELTINPVDSHQYLLDGEFVDMEPTTVRVQALNAEGELEPRTRTLYDTEFGPMFDSLLGLDLFPWTPVKGFALKDVNFQNFRYLNHFAKNNMAQTVGQYDRIQDRFQGIPWVNSIAADRSGRAYYSMDGAIPNVPESKATGCSGVLGLALYPLTGIPVLDGSRRACGWDTDPEAVAPGIFAPDRIPELIRRDYVTNGNDSHWMSNPEEPLAGFDRIIGDEGTVRSLRTRLGLKMVQERLAGTDGLKGKGFTLRNLARVALANRQYAGELWRDDLVSYCQGQPALVSAGACAALAEWDGRNELRSRGAILFQRFVGNLLGNFQALPSGTSSSNYLLFETAFTTPFNAGDPVNTPSGLNTLNPLVGQALQTAVSDLQGAGIPLDAPLRNWQYEERGGDRIPIHGGPGTYGVFNAIGSTWDPAEGYSDVPHGTSFIAAMQFRKHGCPARALTFVSYSQSENPRSRHANDYTKAFSRERWNPVPFCANEVRRKTLDRYRVRAGR